MTAAEMNTAIGLILDDPNETRWTAVSSIKDQALNAAQYKIIKSLPSDLLTELQKSEDLVGIAAVGYTLSGLTTNMIPGRFSACNVTETGGGVTPVSRDIWTKHIWIDDMEFRDQNYYMKGSDTVPISYIFGGKLYILVTSYTVKCTLYYIGIPTTIVSGGAACDLDVSRHDLVVNAACAELLRWEGEIEDAVIFEKSVGGELITEIQTFQMEKRRLNRM